MKIENFDDLQNYFRKENIFNLLGLTKIGVFGSFARDEKFKDIDLLIEETVSLEALISLQNVLKKDIEIPIDIVLSKYAEPIILYRAKQDIRYARV